MTSTVDAREQNQDARAVLEERARSLAQPLVTPDRQSARELLLLFARGTGRYAIDTRYVIQVVSLVDYTPLPFAPAPCLGLASARGELVPLFDLAPLTGDAVSDESEPRTLLLCGESKLEFGLAVDAALDLIEPSASLEPAHDERKLVSGVDARGFVVIDGAALLSDPRLTLSHQEVAL
jgi:chemotaxis signal transduction protein